MFDCSFAKIHIISQHFLKLILDIHLSAYQNYAQIYSSFRELDLSIVPYLTKNI